MTKEIDQQARFGSELSRVLFDDRSKPDAEARLVDHLCARIRGADRAALKSAAAFLDDSIIPRVSGPSILRIAEALEANAPELIESMQSLSRHRQHLARASHMAAVFSKAHLDGLAKAFKDEAARG